MPVRRDFPGWVRALQHANPMKTGRRLKPQDSRPACQPVDRLRPRLHPSRSTDGSRPKCRSRNRSTANSSWAAPSWDHRPSSLGRKRIRAFSRRARIPPRSKRSRRRQSHTKPCQWRLAVTVCISATSIFPQAAACIRDCYESELSAASMQARRRWFAMSIDDSRRSASWTSAAPVRIAGMVEVGRFLCRTAIVARIRPERCRT